MENKILTYIEGRTLHLLEATEILASKVEKGGTRVQELVEEVKKRKRENPELTSKEVKPLLVDIQMEHYNNVLLDTEVKRNVTTIGENFFLLKTFDYKGSFTKEAENLLNKYYEMSKPIFIVEKNDVKVASEDIHQAILKKIVSTTDDEIKLDAFFKGPNFVLEND
jgi:uncharacterized protein YpuA (DUF1002 family)